MGWVFCGLCLGRVGSVLRLLLLVYSVCIRGTLRYFLITFALIKKITLPQKKEEVKMITCILSKYACRWLSTYNCC